MGATLSSSRRGGPTPRRTPRGHAAFRSACVGCASAGSGPETHEQEAQMDYFQAVVLGIVEGLTEFLPVSSTGHLTIAEQILGLDVNDTSVTGFTAVIQTGAILAVVIYFRSDI